MQLNPDEFVLTKANYSLTNVTAKDIVRLDIAAVVLSIASATFSAFFWSCIHAT